MVVEIKWSKKAKATFDDIVDFITENWSEKSAKKFVRKTEHTLMLISQNPKIFAEVDKKNIRKGIIVKQISVFYRVYNQHIRIITFWDNRRNPNNLKI